MRIAVVVARSLQGSGFATRVSSMLKAYAARGHEVDVFHYRFEHEDRLPSAVISVLGRYASVPLDDARFRQHGALLPPLAWTCLRASSRGTPHRVDGYDVVQAETSNTWYAARTLPATKRIAVLHDDDSSRLRGLAQMSPGGPRRVLKQVSAHKYSRLQRIVMEGADRIWFVSEVERDRLAAGVSRGRTSLVPNGADDELWLVPPLDASSSSEVLFVGPGFYEANAAGLAWFMKEVWPLVEQRVTGGTIRVVGVGWEHRDSYPGASFAGWRESLVDEYSRARVVIAPLFAGGGTKLKVVEAMAAGRPVVTTPLGDEGIPRSDGVRMHTDPREFASEVVRFLTDGSAASSAGAANRTAVDGLRWSSIWARAAADLDELVGVTR